MQAMGGLQVSSDHSQQVPVAAVFFESVAERDQQPVIARLGQRFNVVVDRPVQLNPPAHWVDTEDDA